MYGVCANCVYYEGSLCKRYPPTPLLMTPSDIVVSFQPTTRPDNWCGEFRDGKTTDT